MNTDNNIHIIERKHDMTSEHSETMDWSAFLLAEQVVLGLFGKLLFDDPDKEWLEMVAKEGVFEEIPFADGQEDVQQGMALLQAWNEENKNGLSVEAFEALRDDYTPLFIGPGKVKAPPWESIYFTKERSIFREETLAVREWYRRYGLESVKLYHEPDDHIGLELAFLSHLAGLAFQALEEGDSQFGELLQAQKTFLSEHTLKWVAGWSGLVLEHARTDFFKGVALVVRGVMKELQGKLVEA